MPRNEQPKADWSSVKSALSDFDRESLLALIRDIHALSPGNKQFLQARFKLERDPVAYSKRLIAECMCPDPDRPVQISKAKKAISNYRKAANDMIGEIDLMVHFVECGNQFTLEYGDIDEPFYDSLVGLYVRAIAAVLRQPSSRQEPFRKRLLEVARSSEGIGWGYHDGLCDAYYSAFPEPEA